MAAFLVYLRTPARRRLVSGLALLLVVTGLAFLLAGLGLPQRLAAGLAARGWPAAAPFWLCGLLPLLAGLGLALLARARSPDDHPPEAAATLAAIPVPEHRLESPSVLLPAPVPAPPPPARIVAIGGGTGLPSLLRGLTPHTDHITAIVTVADDGGSSGRLRRELGVLPPGDFRNNLAALARDEAMMTQVLQYRFGGLPGNGPAADALPAGGDLRGHAFGNLLLAALTGITGSFDEALLAAQEVLALRGQVLPSTLANVVLVADIEYPGRPVEELVEVNGESAITAAGGRIRRVRLSPDSVRAYPPALRAIFQADLIVLGPGSLYTSILPNLLVSDLAEALIHAQGRVVYVCNLAQQPGETDDYTVADHVDALLAHVPPGTIDLVLANDNLSVDPATAGGRTRYVVPQPPADIPLITRDLVDEARPWRHDSAKLGRAILELIASP